VGIYRIQDDKAKCITLTVDYEFSFGTSEEEAIEQIDQMVKMTDNDIDFTFISHTPVFYTTNPWEEHEEE